MTDRFAKNMAASVRQRLLNHSRATGESYNALLTQYAIERFLYRLSKSDLSKRFVFSEPSALLFYTVRLQDLIADDGGDDPIMVVGQAKERLLR